MGVWMWERAKLGGDYAEREGYGAYGYGLWGWKRRFMMKRLMQLVLVLVMFLGAGCGPDVSGPEGVAKAINKAYEGGKINDFLKLHHTDSKKELAYIREGFRFAMAWKKTGAVIDEVYGKGTWENEFIEKTGETDKEKGTKASYKFLEVPGLGKMWTYGLTIKMVGEDQAVVTRNTHQAGLRMIKKGGKWFVDGRLGKKSKEVGYLDTLIVAIKELKKQLGWLRKQAMMPGKTWEDFQVNLGQMG